MHDTRTPSCYVVDVLFANNISYRGVLMLSLHEGYSYMRVNDTGQCVRSNAMRRSGYYKVVRIA